MGRSFSGNNDYMQLSEAPVSSRPFTMACWAYTNNTDVNLTQGLLQLFKATDTDVYFLLYLFEDSGGIRHLRVECKDIYTTKTKQISNYPLNEWFHACGVFVSSSIKYVYLNGNKAGGFDYPPDAVSGINRFNVAKREHDSKYLCGRLAEVAIWNDDLTYDEVEILADGFSPLFVRPQKLLAYWPFIGQGIPDFPPPDIVNGYVLTEYNTPGVVAHPRIIYPASPFISTSFTVGGISRPLVGGSVAACKKGLVA